MKNCQSFGWKKWASVLFYSTRYIVPTYLKRTTLFVLYYIPLSLYMGIDKLYTNFFSVLLHSCQRQTVQKVWRKKFGINKLKCEEECLMRSHFGGGWWDWSGAKNFMGKIQTMNLKKKKNYPWINFIYVSYFLPYIYMLVHYSNSKYFGLPYTKDD